MKRKSIILHRLTQPQASSMHVQDIEKSGKLTQTIGSTENDVIMKKKTFSN